MGKKKSLAAWNPLTYKTNYNLSPIIHLLIPHDPLVVLALLQL